MKQSFIRTIYEILYWTVISIIFIGFEKIKGESSYESNYDTSYESSGENTACDGKY